MSKEIYDQISLLAAEELTVSTQDNLFAIQALVIEHHGGWTSSKGDTNYYELMSVPSFKTFEDAQKGLTVCKERRLERDNWLDANQTYTDKFYKEWLTERMKDWPLINHLYHMFVDNEAWTFDECKLKLVKKLATERASEGSLSKKLLQLTVQHAAEKKKPFDTEDYQFQIQATSMAPSSGREYMSGPCFYCKKMGHIRANCPEISKGGGQPQRSSYQPPYSRGQGSSGPQPVFNRSFADFRVNKPGQASSSLGKRTADGTGAVMPNKSVRFDTAKETWPKRGPGPGTMFRAAATVSGDEEDRDFREFQMQASQAFEEHQRSQWEEYKASKTVVDTDDYYIVNKVGEPSVTDGEEPYQPDLREQWEKDWCTG
jgi:hypothetical protein